MRYLVILIITFVIISCKNETKSTSLSSYFNYQESSGVESAGIKMIPIKTAVGEFKVWTKRFGKRLPEITIPTLMIGAKYDTMDPKAMEEQSKLVKKGRYLYCPNGSHLAMWDDQKFL